jgi:hypothetical protein
LILPSLVASPQSLSLQTLQTRSASIFTLSRHPLRLQYPLIALSSLNMRWFRRLSMWSGEGGRAGDRRTCKVAHRFTRLLVVDWRAGEPAQQPRRLSNSPSPPPPLIKLTLPSHSACRMPRIPYKNPAKGTSVIGDAIRERRGARGLTPLDQSLLNAPEIAVRQLVQTQSRYRTTD